jgi:hypothetical protein
MFHGAMHPYLERCLSSVELATAGLTEAQATSRAGGGWSIAEIVEHLDRAYSGTAKGLERCLATDRASASAPTIRSRLRTLVVVGLGFFPRGREAPKHVRPTGALGLAEALDSARRSLRAFDVAAIGATARFGRARVLDHPILGPFTVDEWRRFHWIHTRHHRKQIELRRRQL